MDQKNSDELAGLLVVNKEMFNKIFVHYLVACGITVA
jgi:hypothetical protein